MKNLIKYTLLLLATAGLCTMVSAQEEPSTTSSCSYTKEELSYVASSNPLLAMYLSWACKTDATEKSVNLAEHIRTIEETLGITTYDAIYYAATSLLAVEAIMQANGRPSPVVMPLARFMLHTGQNMRAYYGLLLFNLGYRHKLSQFEQQEMLRLIQETTDNSGIGVPPAA